MGRTTDLDASMSRRFLGLDWSDHLPIWLESGVRVELATLDDVMGFARDHYARIFRADPSDDRFFPDPVTPAKLRFLAEADRFVFRDREEIIGLLVGHPTDWSTYYWRTVAFLPEHQGRGLLAAVLERTDRVLREAGIARVEGETAPMNYRQVRLLSRLGYCVTGQVNSERWGTLLRLTKYLDPEAERRFVGQFCRDRELPMATPSHHSINQGGDHEEVRDDVPLIRKATAVNTPLAFEVNPWSKT